MSGKDDIGGTIEDFDIGEQLGKGGFATVFRARCLNTGRDVAIKKINKSQITAGGLISRVRQEVTIHSHLSHPSILQLFTFFEDHHYVYLVLELCAKGELQKHLKGLGRVLTEGEAREYLRQIVDGMLYLHSKSIIHRDLTLSNILLDGHEQVKIADFGLATQLQRPDDRHTTMCGTPNYISPEVVTRSSHGLESDVWSLGCMLFIMLVGHPPFDAKGLKESIFTKVVMGDYKVPSYVSAEARSLIAECLQKNPKERIKLSQVPYHSFMTTRSKTDTSRVSDSGLYTMTTVATTHHTRAPLTVISESEVSHSERGSRPEGQRTTSTHSEPYFRHPPSPPVRMKSSPRDLLPPNAGIIDNLKRKFTPLPSMRREDYAFPAPPPPPPARRERDISEEWHKRQQHHQQASDLRYSSSSSCDDKSSCHSGSAPQWGPRGTSNQTRTKTKEHSEVRQRVTGSPKKSRTLKRSTHMRESDMSGAHASDQPPESNQSSGEFARERYSIHQSHSFDGSQNSGYSENLDRGRGRESRNLMRLADHYQCDESQYGHIRPNQRPRSESRSHDYSHSRHGGTARGVPTHHRSRSLEKYRVTDDCRKREPEQHSARDRSREAFRDRTHSCCQSSHHRSSCDRGAQEALGMVSSVSCNSRHRGTDSRGWNTDREAHSSGHSQVSGSIHHKGARLHSKTQTTGSNNDSHGNMLSDIPAPPHTTPANASGDSKTSSSTQRPANPQGPVTPSKSSTAAQTLRQQVSPLSSRRLKKVRYRSNKYFLNILENGEVCLEHLSVRRNQEVVDDVCRISPDGLRIVIYRPNGGLGSAPGEAPPPLPDEGVDLIFSYENLPSKYWTKYKAAARFVKLLRSRTTKITYYSDQAKFYLMENSPDPDFVGQFYQGTKITQSSSNVVVVEGTGTSHTVPRSSAPTALPHHLQSLHFHFKQVYDHCLCLERVLDDLAHKTELGCFPTTMGTKPPSATASPPMSSRGRGYHLCDKENLSPSSLQSFKSPRNIVSQLGSFEASIASVQVGPPLGDPPAPRAPLTPHNAQPLPQHPQKASPFRVYVQNIGWASKVKFSMRYSGLCQNCLTPTRNMTTLTRRGLLYRGQHGSNGEVSVEYLDGSRVQVSSNSPKVVFMEASGTSTTYSVKDNLPLSLKEKLAQMETVLSCLTQSSTPKASHSSLR